MGFDEIVKVTGGELELLLDLLGSNSDADEMRFVIDEGGLKVKFDQRAWTRALGEMTEH